jgi:hypothetical protein
MEPRRNLRRNYRGVEQVTFLSQPRSAIIRRTPVKKYSEHLRDLIIAGRAKPSQIVSHHIEIEEAVDAYKKWDQRAKGYKGRFSRCWRILATWSRREASKSAMSLSALKSLGVLLLTGMLVTVCGAKEAAANPSQQEQSTPAPPQKHVPHTPIDKKAAELGKSTWNSRWNAIVEQALPPDLLSNRVPRDVRTFCPRFYVMDDSDKRVFWAYFFQALAGAEAGLNPQAKVRHLEPKLAKQENVAPNKVLTEGLLQLTYADEQRYGCPFDEQADRSLASVDPARTILQPKNNLIYWATLRPGTLSYRVFAKQMTNPPAACGLRRVNGTRKPPVREVAQ